LAGEAYDRVCLLSNYDPERARRYCDWLASRVGVSARNLARVEIDLPSPVDYDAIHSEVSKALLAAGLPRDEVDLTFHLSPGTPAMAVIWIVLARTGFPARLIQTTRDRGIQEVRFFIDVAEAFLPEYLRRRSQKVEKLASAPRVPAPEFSAVVHGSEVVAHQMDLARRMSAYHVPVLILGETGTGKELFAEAIHKASRRATGPFVPVNCAAISPELASSELFGHVRGAFTGAVRDHKGHFQEACGGTLFLDEVGDLPLDTQARLLRVLQSKMVMPVGGSKSIPVDVRILAATHRDLSGDVAVGRFREDLFHRLAVGILNLPPLRERGDDVVLLADHFLERINAEGGEQSQDKRKYFSADAKNVLASHSWPGNVRELYHTLVRAAMWARDEVIEATDIQAALLPPPTGSRSPLDRPIGQGLDLEELLDDAKRHYLRLALDKTGGRKAAAAKLLGLSSHQTLSNWMRRLGMEDLPER
jgi:DNA-binding NtrC family response regulator